MEWTIFDPAALPRNAREIYTTLNPKGEFYLNAAALRRLGHPPAVRLMFNRERGLIGIAPVPLKSKGTFVLRRKDGDRVASRVVAAASFCRVFNLLPEKTIQFRNPRIDENGILILDSKATAPALQRGTFKPPEPETLQPGSTDPGYITDSWT